MSVAKTENKRVQKVERELTCKINADATPAIFILSCFRRQLRCARHGMKAQRLRCDLAHALGILLQGMSSICNTDLNFGSDVARRSQFLLE